MNTAFLRKYIKRISTALLDKNPDETIGNYKINEDAIEVSYPKGQVSSKVSVYEKDKYRAIFKKQECAAYFGESGPLVSVLADQRFQSKWTIDFGVNGPLFSVKWGTLLCV